MLYAAKVMAGIAADLFAAPETLAAPAPSWSG
jgi:hypothetical protein